METIKKLESLSEFNVDRGQQTLHPLVTVLDQSRSTLIKPRRFISELYIIFLKAEKCADLRYGRSHYDYQEESLIFIAPGQLETGQSAQDYLQSKIINVAKELMYDAGKSISEIAYELGFKYPQQFTRLFKQRVGQSPQDYRLFN